MFGENEGLRYRINDRVSVYWKEAKSRHSGTICEVHANGSYDIVYDETVKGKQCVEVNAEEYRIESDDNYFFNDEVDVKSEDSYHDEKEDDNNDLNTDKSILHLLKAQPYEEGEDRTRSISHADAFNLHKGLNDEKIQELYDVVPDKLNSICDILCEYVNNNEDQFKQPLVELSVLESLDTSNKLTQWIKSQRNEEDSQLQLVLGTMSSCTTLLKTLTFTSFLQFGKRGGLSGGVSVSEEFVERSIDLMKQFITINVLASPYQKNGKDEAKGKGNKGKTSLEAIYNKATPDLYKTVFPAIVSYIQALECLLANSKQTDRISMSAVDLVFLILKLDASAGSHIEALSTQAAALLLGLHKAAISLLRVLFVHYSTQRTSILVECLTLMSLVYAPKNPSKLYALHYSNQTIGEHGRHATTACIAVLTCLQSCVSISSGLNVLSETTPGALSNQSLFECRKSCAIFVAELFKRCSHKEASTEYRSVATHFLTELFAATLLPAWPICSILLDIMSKRLITVLNSVSSGVSETKRDVPFVNFLLDLVGTICCNLHKVDKIVEEEINSANNKVLSAGVRESLRQKINLLKPTWLSFATVSPSPTKVESHSSEKSNNKKSKKSSTKNIEDVDEASTTPSKDKKLMLDTQRALAILSEISSLCLDAVNEQPLQIDIPSEGVSSSSNDSTPRLALIPPVHVILTQLEGQEDLIDALPDVTLVDLNYVHVNDHLQKLVESSSHVKSESKNAAIDALSLSKADEFLRDALDVTQCLWHQDADIRKRLHVAEYLQQALAEEVKARKPITSLDTQDTVLKNNKSRYSFYSNRDEYSWRGKYSLESITENIRYLLVDRLFKQLFELVLEVLLGVLEDSSPVVRSKALKCLTSLLSSDADLITRQLIREAITKRFKDRAISVREEAVKLVGSYIVRGWDAGASEGELNVTSGYLEGLKLRLSADEGISVRKSVVNIFKEILLHQPNHSQYSELCLLMLKQAAHPKEEDTIKDVIQATFQTIWFLPPSSNAIQSNAKLTNLSNPVSVASFVEMDRTTSDFVASTPTRNGVHSKNSTPTTRVATPASSSRNRKVKEEEALLHHIESTARQLVDIISIQALDASNVVVVHSWIISLLRDVLHAKSQGDEVTSQLKQRRATSHAHVEKIVTSLVELLLKAEESESSLLLDLQKRSMAVTQFIVNTIVTISLLCEAHPPLICKHLDTLLPYLQGDPKCSKEQNDEICLKITQILASTAMLERSSLKIKNVSEVLTNLNNIALRYRDENVSSAIRCMTLLIANITEDASPIFNLANRCYQVLIQCVRRFPNPEEYPVDYAKSIMRHVLVLGCVCEHLNKCQAAFLSFATNFVSDQVTNMEISPSALRLNTLYNSSNADELLVKNCTFEDIVALHPNAIFGAVYVALIYVLGIPSVSIQKMAVQSLCSVFIGYPRLLRTCQESGLLSDLLGQKKSLTFHEDVHFVFITSLKHMMSVEEQRLEQQAAINLMKESGMNVISSKSVGETILGQCENEAESSNAGFVLQQQLPLIATFLLAPDLGVRKGALQLIGTLLRQGMLCPLDVINQLIAFMGDSSAKIRAESLAILLAEDERRPTYLDNRLIDGIESTVTFQMKTIGTLLPTGLAHVYEDDKIIAASYAATRPCLSIFSSIYIACVQPNKTKRSNLLSGLLKRCNGIFSSIRDAFAEHPQSIESCTIAIAAATAALQQQLDAEKLAAANASAGVNVISETSMGSEVAVKPSPLKRADSGKLLKRTSSMTSNVSGGDTPNSFKRTGSVSSLSTSNTNRKGNNFFLQTTEDALHKFKVVDFMCTTLAYLPYDTIAEPLYIIYWINRYSVLSISIVLSKLKHALLSVGNELRGATAMQPPTLGTKPSTLGKRSQSQQQLSDSDIIFNEQAFVRWLSCTGSNNILKDDTEPDFTLETVDPVTNAMRIIEIITLIVELRSKEAAIRLKAFLKSWYSISDDKCTSYNPTDTTTNVYCEKATVVEPFPSYVPNQVDAVQYTDLVTSDLVQGLVACIQGKTKTGMAAFSVQLVHLMKCIVGDYNRIEALLHLDPDDFTLVTGLTSATGGTKKRKKSVTTPSGEGSEAKPKSSGASKARAKPKGTSSTKKRKSYVDSDDDGDDDDVDGYNSFDEDGSEQPSSSTKTSGVATLRGRRASTAKKAIYYSDEDV